jgi:hypothetical protein
MLNVFSSVHLTTLHQPYKLYSVEWHFDYKRAHIQHLTNLTVVVLGAVKASVLANIPKVRGFNPGRER